MKTLVNWLRRLEAPPEPLNSYLFRLTVPGLEPLDLADWILSAEPRGPLPRGLGDSTPEALSILGLVDVPGQKLPDRHRFGAELACLLSLALGRRVRIAHEIMIDVPQLGRLVTMPFQQTVDRQVLGPLPSDPRALIDKYLAAMLGLEERDLDIIGAAASVLHGALLLLDHDVRAAYALLISGIEILSREYGNAPSAWQDWEDAKQWDAFLETLELTHAQMEAVRAQLMANRQLRLKATFRSYASARLPHTFWDQVWEEWTYVINANEERWTNVVSSGAQTIRDFVPEDREGLSRALGLSYDLRSGFVHRGDWFELLQLATFKGQLISFATPLPFAVLRAILAELIWLEASEHSAMKPLPDVGILRTPPGGGPTA